MTENYSPLFAQIVHATFWKQVTEDREKVFSIDLYGGGNCTPALLHK